MRIDDEEMRDLFRIESEEHLQHLDEGLLALEKDPGNRAMLDQVFREAHSLKGAARMLGLTPIETVSHCIEEILGGACGGHISICRELIDRLYGGLDGLRTLVAEALTGEESSISAAEIMGSLKPRGHEDGTAGTTAPGYDSAPVQGGKSEQVAEAEEALPAAGGPRPPDGCPGNLETFRIETMRVKTRDLDTLMSHMAELSVAKIRIAGRLGDMDRVLGLWDELGRTNRLPSVADGIDRVGRMLGELRTAVHQDSERLEFVANALEDGIHSVRLLPISTIFNLFPRMVRDLAQERSKEISLVVEGGDTCSDKRIIEEMKDPLMHLIRNAADHGIEPPEEREAAGKPRCGTILLKAERSAAGIRIEVRDDGRGLDDERIRAAAMKLKPPGTDGPAAMDLHEARSLIFAPGFSTSRFVTEVSGRGVGLDVVRDRVEDLKGTIRVESDPGKGCAFRMQLPLTLATVRVLIVMVNGIPCAIPVEHVLTTRLVRQSDLFAVEGADTLLLDDRPVSVARLSDLLRVGRGRWGRPGQGAEPPDRETKVPCVIISVGDAVLGLLVDELRDEQEIVLKPGGAVLKRVRNVAGAVILGTGQVGIVLNPHDLVRSALKSRAPAVQESAGVEEERKKVILSVDDSVITRTQMKRILEGAGYEVVSAVDGLDALAKLGSRSFDAVVSDVLMPNMDGLALTAKIREEKRYRELPVVLVTTLASQEDRKRGIDAGANAYIAKPAFDQRLLLDTLRRLI